MSPFWFLLFIPLFIYPIVLTYLLHSFWERLFDLRSWVSNLKDMDASFQGDFFGVDRLAINYLARRKELNYSMWGKRMEIKKYSPLGFHRFDHTKPCRNIHYA